MFLSWINACKLKQEHIQVVFAMSLNACPLSLKIASHGQPSTPEGTKQDYTSKQNHKNQGPAMHSFGWLFEWLTSQTWAWVPLLSILPRNACALPAGLDGLRATVLAATQSQCGHAHSVLDTSPPTAGCPRAFSPQTLVRQGQGLMSVSCKVAPAVRIGPKCSPKTLLDLKKWRTFGLLPSVLRSYKHRQKAFLPNQQDYQAL